MEESKNEADMEMDPIDAESPDMAIAVSRIVATAAQDCISLFRKVSEEKAWAQDQLARFNVWVNNIGVFARGQGSLDYRLRDAPEILDLMMQQVGVLRANLEALCHPEESRTGFRELDNTNVSESVRADTPSHSPSSDASSLISGSDSSLPEFDSMLMVEETITRVYKLSAAIRKSGSLYRDLRAERYLEVETLDDGTSMNLTQIFLEDFAMKVIPHRVPRRVDETEGLCHPIAEKWLLERLARTIAKRRNRFLYWRKHQEKLEKLSWISQPVSPSGSDSEAAPDRNSLNVPAEEVSDWTTRVSNPIHGKSISGTEDTRHTPIDKIKFPIFTASKKGSAISAASFISNSVNELPGPPRIDPAETHFTCPLCFILCDAKEAQGKHWTQHIFRDLKPYICLFEDCKNPDVLFGSFREWIAHMLEDRNVSEWLCVSAAHPAVLIFSTERSFKDHWTINHESSFSESQLSKLAQRNMRPAFELFNNCPLCDFAHSPSGVSDREAQDVLQRHIAEHLHALSLFSLPNRVDDGFTYAPSEGPSGITGERSSLDLDAFGSNSDLAFSDMGANNMDLDQYPSPWSEWQWSDKFQCYERYRLKAPNDYEYDHGQVLKSSAPTEDLPEQFEDPQNKGKEVDAYKAFLANYTPRQRIFTRDPKSKTDLDPNFVVHKSKEFYFGRIFKVLWSEPYGSGGTEITERALVKAKLGTLVYYAIRRFMIVDGSKKGHCICLPILTYGGQGTLKHGVHPEDHAQIYTLEKNQRKAPALLQNEGPLSKNPIRVVPVSPSHKLDPASRINYAKLYVVEHNVKVFFVGWVAKKFEQHVVNDYNNTHRPLPDRPFDIVGIGGDVRGTEGDEPEYPLPGSDDQGTQEQYNEQYPEQDPGHRDENIYDENEKDNHYVFMR